MPNGATDAYMAEWDLNAKYGERLKDNDEIFLLIAQNHKTDSAHYKPHYEGFLKMGYNGIIFEDASNRSHNYMYQDFIEHGFLDMLTESGEIDFSKFESYQVYVNGQLVNVDSSEINTYEKLCNYFGYEYDEHMAEVIEVFGNSIKISLTSEDLNSIKSGNARSLVTDITSAVDGVNGICSIVQKNNFEVGSQTYKSTSSIPGSLSDGQKSMFSVSSELSENILR